MDDADKLQPGAGINEIELSKIEANPFQPRTKFDEESLKELSASIKEIGLIQPITLRKVNNDKYQIIAGERRFRASQMAGLETIPAYVRKAKDDGMLEMALVENIQREDLDAIEIALSYQRLLDELEFISLSRGLEKTSFASLPNHNESASCRGVLSRKISLCIIVFRAGF